MARQYEKRYRLNETDDVLQKLRAIFQDLDQRMDAVEIVKEAFEKGNRLDIEALLKALDEDISHKSAAMQELIDEVADGFTPDRISETVDKRFTSNAEQQAHVDGLAEANNRISARATSAALGAHTAATNNPHNVTAAQVGTLTTAEIDADLDQLEALILGTASPAADTLGKIEALLAKRLRVETAQSFTPAEKGQAIANLGGGVLTGFRNKIINGDFSINQRGNRNLAPGENMIVLDRWYVTNNTNQTVGVSQQAFAPGQVEVPGDPAFYLNLNFPVAPTSGTLGITQRIESVRTLAGKRATVTAFTSGPSANSGPLDCSLGQNFGVGGAPSASVITPVPLNISTVYDAVSRRRQGVVDLPAIAGKTLGTTHDGYVALAFTLTPRAAGNYSIARVSVVEGDATAEADPSSPRHIQQELALCQRYLEDVEFFWLGDGINGNFYGAAASFKVTKRTTPSASSLSQSGASNGGMNARSLNTVNTRYASILATMSAASGASRGFNDSWRFEAEL